MDDLNPYAPPRHDGPFTAPAATSTSPDDWWFEGDKVVVRDGGSLPTDICIKTGERCETSRTKKVTWAPQWVFIVFVLSWLIGLIIYMVIKKSGTFTYGMSQAHIQRRKLGLMVALGGSLGAIGLFVAGAAANNGPLLALGGIGIFAAIIVGVVMANSYQVTKIRDGVITLKVDKRFRAALER